MNKFLTALNYICRMQWIKVMWYLAIYPAVVVVVYWALVKTSIVSETQGSLMYRLWGSVFLMFAISIQFKEDYDFLLTMSITRRDIFLAKLVTAVGLGGFFGLLIIGEKLLIDYLNNLLNFHNHNDLFFLFAPYSQNEFVLFLYFVMFVAMCVSFSILIGSLFYRLGKKFVLIFWLVFSAIPFIFLPGIMMLLHQQGVLGSSFQQTGQYLQHFNVIQASFVLFLISILFSAVAWLNIRRLPVK